MHVSVRVAGSAKVPSGCARTQEHLCPTPGAATNCPDKQYKAHQRMRSSGPMNEKMRRPMKPKNMVMGVSSSSRSSFLRIRGPGAGRERVVQREVAANGSGGLRVPPGTGTCPAVGRRLRGSPSAAWHTQPQARCCTAKHSTAAQSAPDGHGVGAVDHSGQQAQHVAQHAVLGRSVVGAVHAVRHGHHGGAWGRGQGNKGTCSL